MGVADCGDPPWMGGDPPCCTGILTMSMIGGGGRAVGVGEVGGGVESLSSLESESESES